MIMFGKRAVQAALADFLCHRHAGRIPQGLGNQLIEWNFICVRLCKYSLMRPQGGCPVSVRQRTRRCLMHSLPACLGLCFFALLLYSRQGTPPTGQKPSASPVQAQTALPTEMDNYRRARTVIDMTREELLQTYPDELRDLELVESQQELDPLLQKVGENVERFFRDFPNTISKEQVRRERFKVDGRVDESVTQNYNYTAYLDKSGGWEEGRTDSGGREIPPENVRSVFPHYRVCKRFPLFSTEPSIRVPLSLFGPAAC